MNKIELNSPILVTEVDNYDPNPFDGWRAYASEDANRIIRSDDLLLGFHLTTPEGFNGILKTGAHERVCKVGFDGREQPHGFWLNCVPFLPYSIEQSTPYFDSDTDMRILGFAVPLDTVRYLHVETTWPFAQWPVSPETIAHAPAFEVTPELFSRYRSNIVKILGYARETIAQGLAPSDGYLAKLIGGAA